jgi:hypothetical protein
LEEVMSELIERLAKEAGLTDPDLGPWMIDYGSSEDSIRKFARLVAEECAKECDSMADKPGTNRLQQLALDLAADSIRAKFPPPEVTG